MKFWASGLIDAALVCGNMSTSNPVLRRHFLGCVHLMYRTVFLCAKKHVACLQFVVFVVAIHV